MATVVDKPKVPLKRSRHETRNDGGSALSTYGLLAPTLLVLAAFSSARRWASPTVGRHARRGA
jgi:hypothetical protein